MTKQSRNSSVKWPSISSVRTELLWNEQVCRDQGWHRIWNLKKKHHPRWRDVTWASASSLKALTRESSFSFSSAHWKQRQTQDTHAFWNFWSFLHKSSCWRPKRCSATSLQRCVIGSRTRLNEKSRTPLTVLLFVGEALKSLSISHFHRHDVTKTRQHPDSGSMVFNLFQFLPLWKETSSSCQLIRLEEPPNERFSAKRNIAEAGPSPLGRKQSGWVKIVTKRRMAVSSELDATSFQKEKQRVASNTGFMSLFHHHEDQDDGLQGHCNSVLATAHSIHFRDSFLRLN